MSFVEEYERLKLDNDRKNAFASSSRERGRRTCSVFNTNIKTLGTYSKYIHNMYGITAYPTDDAGRNDVHQKSSIVKEFNFRSIDNHDDNRAMTRSDIIIKAYNTFGDYDNAFVIITLYILLLGEKKDSVTLQKVLDFWEYIPRRIKRNLNMYVHNIYTNGDYDANNFYQNLVMLYGDEELFNSYIDYLYDNEYNAEEINVVILDEYNDTTTPIGKRISNFQKSSIKKEAYYLFLYFCMKEACIEMKFKYLADCKEFDEGIRFFKNVLVYMDKEPDMNWGYFGKIDQGQNLEMYKQFLDDLTVSEKDEFIICFSNAFNISIKE